MRENKEFDIARSIRAIEGLKIALLSGITDLFRMMQGGARSGAEALSEVLASLILSCYRLGVRTGITPHDIDKRIAHRLKSMAAESPEEMEDGLGMLINRGEELSQKKSVN